MATPLRTLRSLADDLPGNSYILTDQERDRRDLILAAATRIFASVGRHNVSLSGLAHAVHMRPAVVKHLWSDLDKILHAILSNHLREVARAIGDATRGWPPDGENLARGAYFRATRTAMGGYVDAHAILLRDRHMLPPELLENIENVRYEVASFLAPDGQGLVAMDMLDIPYLTPEHAERFLELLVKPQPPAQARPEPPPKPASDPEPPAEAEIIRPKPQPRQGQNNLRAFACDELDWAPDPSRPVDPLAALPDHLLASVGRQPRPPP